MSDKSKPEQMNYIAKCKCGGMVLAVADEQIVMKNHAKDIAKCLRQGFIVERVTTKTVRATPFCKNNGKCK